MTTRTGRNAWRAALIGIALTGALTLIDAPVSSLTLDEAVRMARLYDGHYGAEQYGADADRAEGWRAVAGIGPTVRLSGRYLYSRDSFTPEDQVGAVDRVATFNESDMQISAEQPLIDLAKTAALKRGLADIDRAALRCSMAEDALRLRVSERYIAAALRYRLLLLAEAEQQALALHLDAAEKRLQLGFGTITDRYHAEARLRLAEAAGLTARDDLETALLSLEELIGARISADKLELSPDSYSLALSFSEEYWVAVARRNNAELLSARSERNRASLDRRLARARFFPALVLFADYRDREPDGGLVGNREHRREIDVGVRLEMDLLAGGRDIAGLVAASRREQAARERERAVETATVGLIRSLWTKLAGSRAVLARYRSAVETYWQALEATRTSYHEGTRVLIEVLDAQQDYFRALRSLQTAQHDYVLVREKLTVTAGGS